MTSSKPVPAQKPRKLDRESSPRGPGGAPPRDAGTAAQPARQTGSDFRTAKALFLAIGLLAFVIAAIPEATLKIEAVQLPAFAAPRLVLSVIAMFLLYEMARALRRGLVRSRLEDRTLVVTADPAASRTPDALESGTLPASAEDALGLGAVARLLLALSGAAARIATALLVLGVGAGAAVQLHDVLVPAVAAAMGGDIAMQAVVAVCALLAGAAAAHALGCLLLALAPRRNFRQTVRSALKAIFMPVLYLVMMELLFLFIRLFMRRKLEHNMSQDALFLGWAFCKCFSLDQSEEERRAIERKYSKSHPGGNATQQELNEYRKTLGALRAYKSLGRKDMEADCLDLSTTARRTTVAYLLLSALVFDGKAKAEREKEFRIPYGLALGTFLDPYCRRLRRLSRGRHPVLHDAVARRLDEWDPLREPIDTG